MDNWIMVVGLCLLGYLSGSVPYSILVTRFIKGVDVRDAGSGHATTTNTIRQAGWAAGAFVLVLDMAKGAIPTMIAVHTSPFDWVVPVVAALAVVGHCWPVFANFRGGYWLVERHPLTRPRWRIWRNVFFWRICLCSCPMNLWMR